MVIDFIGEVFGRLTIVSIAGVSRYGKAQNKQTHLNCICECGRWTVVPRHHLKRGGTVSCGCLRIEKTIARNVEKATHGRSKSSEYKSWASMKDRCNNPNNAAYRWYGGRGVKVAERWHSFDNFYADMGLRPSLKHSIDRLNSDGNYEPGNCKWSTTKEQAANRRKPYTIYDLDRNPRPVTLRRMD